MTKRKLPVPSGVFDQHIAVLGKTRSGKSSVMRLLVEHLLDQGEPVCIIDPKGDWWGLRVSADGKSEGYPVVIFGTHDRADITINDQVGADVAELVATGNRPSLIDFGGWTVAARTRFYNAFAESLFRHTVGDRWLVVDEIHNFCPKGSLKGTEGGQLATSLHWTNRLASEGLGKGVHLIFASQRPQKVHNDTLTSAETLIAMRVLHPSDRGAVSDWIAAAGDQSGKQVLDSLADLQRGEGWAWSPEIKFGPEAIQFPLFSTYDSFKAQKVDRAKLKGWGDVDLEETSAKLAAVQEQKKAEDPRELRKQIAELKRELDGHKKRGQVASQNVPSKVVEKPVLVLPNAQLQRLEQLVAKIDALIEKRDETMAVRLAAHISQFTDLAMKIEGVAGLPAAKATSAPIDAALEKLVRVKDEITTALATLAGQNRFQTGVKAAYDPSRPAPTRRPTPLVKTAAARPRTPAIGSDNGLGGPERKILAALAELEALGLYPADKQQLGFMAGYTNVRSGGFSEPMGRLVAGGYVVSSGGQVSFTAQGHEAVDSVLTPATSHELQQRILAQLDGPEQKILRVLLNEYPKPRTKEELAALCDPPYTNTRSGGFSEPMGTLKRLGLAQYPQRGVVRASPALFLEDR